MGIENQVGDLLVMCPQSGLSVLVDNQARDLFVIDKELR